MPLHNVVVVGVAVSAIALSSLSFFAGFTGLRKGRTACTVVLSTPRSSVRPIVCQAR